MSKQHTPGPWTVEGHTVNARGVAYGFANSTASAHELRANARLIAAAPDLLHALKWAAEYVSLYTGDGAGWAGVQQGHDRDRFIDADTGDLDPERLRAFLAATISKAEEG
jgi:hypothetical protein